MNDATFPRIGKGAACFFQGLEKTAGRASRTQGLCSKAWKRAALAALLAAPLCYGEDQPEYTPASAEPSERYINTIAEEASALRRREVDISASARTDLMDALQKYKAQQWDEVIAQLEKLLASDPTPMPAWDMLGSAYWRSGRGDEAFKTWNKLRSIRPDYPPLYTWLGRAYMLSNDLVNARACYSKGLKLQQPLHDEDLNYGRVLRWSGALDEAIQLLRPLVRNKPDRLDIVRELASALTSNREYQEALPLWQKLRASEPTNLLFKAKEAVSLLHTDHPEAAVANAREVLQENPTQLDALGVLADYAQYFSPTPEQALPVLRRMAGCTAKPQKQRQLILRYVNLNVHLRESEPDRFPMDITIGLLADLVAKDPLDTDVRLALGETLAMGKHTAAAREQLEWILKYPSPNNVRALRKLFEIAVSEQRTRDAEELLQRLLHFNPRDPYRHVFLAQFYLAQDRFAKALDEADQLEAEGAQGAIAVLLYHGLSSSDHGEIMPASRLTEHIQALKAAGFTFCSANELNRRLLEISRKAGNLRNMPLEREVCITFDDARRTTRRHVQALEPAAQHPARICAGL
jgi:cytochrome c-type biogenesis protein CcmH/NrfG